MTSQRRFISNRSFQTLTDSGLSDFPYYIVASVEVGNTTTKCILTRTDLRSGMTEVVEKTIRKTASIRAPMPDEPVFAHTIRGISFSRKALAELVCSVISDCLRKAEINVDHLHFAARSSGIISQSSDSKDADEIIRALADGCLMAGVAPSKMNGVLSSDLLPEPIRPFSKLSTVYFDGSVAGTKLPKWQGRHVVPNEMEGELACAGIKEAARHNRFDFRNPCIVLDMGTTLSGRILSKGDPYAETIGNFCGYAGAVADMLVQSMKFSFSDVDDFCALDAFEKECSPFFLENIFLKKKVKRAAEQINALLDIGRLGTDVDFVGPFFVNPKKAEEFDVKIYACRFKDSKQNNSETDGSELRLNKIGDAFYKKHGLSGMSLLVDEVMTDIIVRLLESVSKDVSLDLFCIGITGRAAISGNKKSMLYKKAQKRLGILNPAERFVFTDDGLARGAAVMARCIHSLGCATSPIGGNTGDACIISKRKRCQDMSNTKKTRFGAEY